MPKQIFLNNLDYQFAGAVKAAPETGTPATEIGYGVVVLPGNAALRLTALTGGDFYVLTAFTLTDGLEDDIEIMRVTAVDDSSPSETRLTVLRGQEGTSPRPYAVGDNVSLRFTAGGAGEMLQRGQNLSELTDAATARTNLGLGTAATANTGTGATNVILGNDTRLTDSRTPIGGAGGVLSGSYPNPGFAVDMATQSELDNAIATREPTITAGTTSQFWRGDKSWADFATTVRASVLTGLSTATNAAVAAADSVLAAFGKLQAQINGHFGTGGATHPNAVAGGDAGFMSGADKTKLDGVAAGATANTGTVTSVGLSLPGEFTVSNSPVTGSGTLTAAKASQTANHVWAAPSGTNGAPTFRAIVAADIPVLNQNTTGNAATATALQNARNINGVSFNGSADITVTANTGTSVTFNSGGTGDASGTTFNGGTARTISFNTLGAQAALVSGTNIKTVGGQSLLGSGDVPVGDVTLTGVQTLTNKTLTSPTINTATISGGTINNTPIGATTRAAGNFTTLDANGNVILGDAAADTVTINGTVQPGMVISGSSSGDALRITQTGTGNAFVVEDSASPGSTPFVIDADGRVAIGRESVFGSTGVQVFHRADAFGTLALHRAIDSADPIVTFFSKSRGTFDSRELVETSDVLVRLTFQGYDGAVSRNAASLEVTVDGTPGTGSMPGRLVFSTTPTGSGTPVERMRIDSAGDVCISTTTSENVGFADDTGVVNIGGKTNTANVSHGALNLKNTRVTPAASDVFGGISFESSGSIQPYKASIFALAEGSGGGTGGFGARLAFYTRADNSAATPVERMRIDSAGRVGIGGTPAASYGLSLSRPLSGGVNAYGVVVISDSAADVTGAAHIFSSVPAATNTLATIRHFSASQQTYTGTVTNQYGFIAETTLTGATNNFGFYSNIASGTGRWNFYANGTAQNAFAGFTRIGSTTAPTCALDVTGGIATSRTAVTAPAASDGNVFSGTYTPTLTNTTNVAASTASQCQYMRVGNVVTVSGRVSITPTAANTTTLIGISLPVASSFSTAQQCSGTSSTDTTVTADQQSGGGSIVADTTNNRASLRLAPASTTALGRPFTFTYQVL
jgi:hypothetical protein